MSSADIQRQLQGLQHSLQADMVCLWTAVAGNKAQPLAVQPAGAVTSAFWPAHTEKDHAFVSGPDRLSRLLPMAFRPSRDRPQPVGMLQIALEPVNDQVLGISVLWQQAEHLPPDPHASTQLVRQALSDQLLPVLCSERAIQSARQMRGLADALPQAMVIVSSGHQQGYVNPAAARLLHLTHGDVAPATLSTALQHLVASATNADEVSAYAMPILQGRAPAGDCSMVWHFANAPKALRVTISAMPGVAQRAWVWLLDDVSAEVALRQQLAAKEQKFRSFYLSLRDAVVFYAPDGGIADCNDEFKSLLKVSDGSDLLHAAPHEVASRLGWARHPWDEIGALCTDQRTCGPFEKVITDATGRAVVVESNAYLLTDADNHTTGAWEVLHDVTQRKQAEAELILSAEAFARHSDGVILTDANGIILTVNDAFTKTTGYTRDALRGKRPNLFKSGRHDPSFYNTMREQIAHHGWWQGGVWNRRSDGELFFKWLTINAVRDEHNLLTHYVGVYRDVAAVKHAQTRIDFLATHDELTGLPNSILFQDRLELALKRPRKDNSVVAVVVIDLADFNKIKNALGYQASEATLQEMATRLGQEARPGDTVARRSADQFAMLIEADHTDAIGLRCQQLIAVLQRPLKVGSGTMVATVKVGVSLGPIDGTDAQSLILKADTALLRAKQTADAPLRFFSGDMVEHVTQRFAIENGLRQALQDEELVIQYQPQVSAHDNRLVGCEALIRWRQPSGLVPPGHFIPVAEETGLIIPITEWILAQVARQIRLWDGQGICVHTVSVNISARHFLQPRIVESFQDIMRAENVDPHRICLEITEGALADPVQCEPKLRALKAAGFEISIDDFGTGYSSLSYLKRFRLDELKIDRSFVDGIESDASDRAIVEATLAMAHRLGMRVVAEGVETLAQQAFLQDKGCELLQGYLFSKPIGPDAFGQLTTCVLERTRGVSKS
ncbi:MAG: EAL domain-containing protein [Hydrogenophaga sp.]|nr:EAL domain-containing protein [Hydrogenophaga sp.]